MTQQRSEAGCSSVPLDQHVGLHARREIGKWLNEQPNRDVDRMALAELCGEYDRVVCGIERCYRMLLSEPYTQEALFKAENILHDLMTPNAALSGRHGTSHE